MAFNLSTWALRERSIVVFLMLATVIGGVASYFALGRNEDPEFTFRAMVVQAGWPGATRASATGCCSRVSAAAASPNR